MKIIIIRWYRELTWCSIWFSAAITNCNGEDGVAKITFTAAVIMALQLFCTSTRGKIIALRGIKPAPLHQHCHITWIICPKSITVRSFSAFWHITYFGFVTRIQIIQTHLWTIVLTNFSWCWKWEWTIWNLNKKLIFNPQITKIFCIN